MLKCPSVGSRGRIAASEFLPALHSLVESSGNSSPITIADDGSACASDADHHGDTGRRQGYRHDVFIDVAKMPAVITRVTQYNDTLVKTPQGWRFKIPRERRADFTTGSSGQGQAKQ